MYIKDTKKLNLKDSNSKNDVLLLLFHLFQKSHLLNYIMNILETGRL